MVISKEQVKKFCFRSFPLLFFLLASTSRCEKDEDCPKDPHNDISIENNGSIEVNWTLFQQDSVFDWNGKLPGPDYGLLKPNGTDQYGIRYETCWEVRFHGSQSDYLFFFHHDTVEAIGWEKIEGTNRGLVKRVEVDLDYLRRNHWTIAYP